MTEEKILDVYVTPELKIDVYMSPDVEVNVIQGEKGDKGDPGKDGVTIHNNLSGLDYENSGHSGFASSEQIIEEIQTRIIEDAAVLNASKTYIDGLIIVEKNARIDADTALQTNIDIAEAIARGKSRGRVFQTLIELEVWLLNPLNIAILQIGDNLYIVEREVSDFWWDGIQKQALEGEKVDLTDFYKKQEIDIKFNETNTRMSIIENTIDTFGSKIVSISDFETFNPSISLVDSTTGKTFTLAEGESCQFKSAYNANGKPWMGSGTLGATNNALSSIYYWSGTITRLYGTYYMVTAYGANTTTSRPQAATRVYYGSTRYDWIVSTDFSNLSTSGYTKLPSGVLIQWGAYKPNVMAAYTVTFPISFINVYSAVTNCGDASISTNAATTAAIYSLTVSGMTTLSRYAAYGGAFNWTQETVRWIAIGTWK